MIATKTGSETAATAPIADIKKGLQSASKVLVVTHVDPDGDAIGTQLAFGAFLKDIGKDVTMVRDSEIPDKYSFLANVEQIRQVDEFDSIPKFDTIVVLECPTPERMGKAQKFVSENTKVISIDHHQDSRPYGDINWIDVNASSVGELVFTYFKEVDYHISPEVAEQLFTAILTDTGRFRYDSTSPYTMACAGELIGLGADPQKTCDKVYFDMPPSTTILLGKVLNGIEFHHNGEICLLTLTKEMLEQSGAKENSTEGVVDHTLYQRGVIVGALLKEGDKDSTRVSFRSRNGIDVSRIAASFGGGGHHKAAGCTLPMGLADARLEVIRILTEALERAAE